MTTLVKNSAYYTAMANEALVELTNSKKELAAYMGSKSIAKLKKEVDFLILQNEVKHLAELRNDMLTLAFNTAKLEKMQAKFN